MIPVACVGVHYVNLGIALEFSSVPLHNFVAGQRGSTGRDSPSAGLYLWHPWALRLSPSLPAPDERGGLPFLALPPFHAHVASLVLRVPIRVSPMPSTLSRSLGLLWPTTSVPTTQYSPSQVTLPAGQFQLLNTIPITLHLLQGIRQSCMNLVNVRVAVLLRLP